MAELPSKSHRWPARPFQSLAVRAIVVLTPLVGSLVFVRLACIWLKPPTSSLWLYLVWWATMSTAASAVLFVIYRFTRRLLPLSALLKLSIAFPDETPSRLTTAMRSGGVKTLQDRIELIKEAKAAGTPRESAERLLELVAALNVHDRLTRGHSERVRAYSIMIGKQLGLSPHELDLLNWAALLHDIGKLEVAQEILTKATKPSETEWQMLRQHPHFGEDMTLPLDDWLEDWRDAIGYHHERWDGQGYPHGLSGEDIPLAGRIVAVADVFDVITSARSYKEAGSSLEGRKEITRCAGSQFDPKVVRAFLNVSLGRMRLVVGPLAWLSHAPLLSRLPLTPALGTLAGSMSVIATAAATGLLTPPAVVTVSPAAVVKAVAAQPATTTPKPAGVRRPVAPKPLPAPIGVVVPRPTAAPIPRRGPTAAPTATTPASESPAPVPTGPLQLPQSSPARPSPTAAPAGAPPVAAPDEPVVTPVPPPAAAPEQPPVTTESPAAAAPEQPADPVDPPAAPEQPADTETEQTPPAPDVSPPPPVTTTPSIPIPPPPIPPAAKAPLPEQAPTTTEKISPPPAPVNDPPSFSPGADQTRPEDAPAQTVSGWATAISPGPASESEQTVTFSTDNDNNALFSSQPELTADGDLTYTPAANANGAATVTVTAADDGGGGDDTSPAQTFTITITPVNDPPTFDGGGNETTPEDAAAVTVPGWATAISAGPADESTQTVTFSTSNDNNALFSSQPHLAADGALTYRPAAGATGAATVTVTATDDGGGADTSPAQTFTITITSVNDPPSFTAGADQTALEDAAAQTVPGWATAISAGPANESAQTVTFSTSNSNNPLFSGQPHVAANGALTYRPAANENGVATVTVTATDSGGGADTSPAQTFTITITPVNDPPSFAAGADQTALEDAAAQTVPGWATAISAGPANESTQTVTFGTSNDNNALFSSQPHVAANGALTYTAAADQNGVATVTVTATDSGGGADTSPAQTFTITINPVNDQPSFTAGADQTRLEDAAAVSVPGWATAISSGPSNESSQTVTFTTGNNNNALFSSQPAIAANGALTYTPAADQNGAATVTVTATDSGGGADTSPAQTFTITITPVNDPPSFAAGADQTKLEDAAAVTVPGWATAISAGPANESAQTVTFSASNNNNALFSSQPAIAANGALTYTPAANANGAATVTVTATDSGAGADTSPAQTFTINITAVNDPPSFAAGANQTALEDAAAVTVPGWATAISSGPANESAQTVTFNASNNNNALFSSQPAIAANGALTYTPAANANGAATVTLTATDSGGGADTSPAQTFTITITPVNDPPSFTAGANQTAVEAADAQTVPGWATAISAGPGDESGQTIAFAAGNDNNALFDPAGQPAIAGDGTLTYMPAPDQYGSATVTVTATDSGGGNDTSSAQTFTITTSPAPPVAGDDAYATTMASALIVAAPGLLANDADANGSPLAVVTTPISGPTSGALTLHADGSFAYTPSALFLGTDSFTYQIGNGLGLTATATATISVTAGAVAPDVLYLGTTGPTADVWTMDATSPTGGSSVPDYDSDGNPGLSIHESNGKENNSDPKNDQYWSYTVSAPLLLNGPIALDLYSALQGFHLLKQVQAYVYLYDCNSTATICTKIAENSILVPDWSLIANFAHQHLTVGSVTRVVPPGDQLRVRLLFKNSEIWVAMTATYPSALSLTLGP